MKLFHSKLGLIFSLSYLTIFLFSGVYAMYLLVFHTANSEFSGVLAILVILPWSIILIPFDHSLGIIAWYEKFSGNPAVYGFFAMLTLLPAALFNAAILYFVRRGLDSVVEKRIGKK